jgi:hypothetical protein
VSVPELQSMAILGPAPNSDALKPERASGSLQALTLTGASACADHPWPALVLAPFGTDTSYIYR